MISVGASISKETWAANYGSNVTKKYDMLPFSSRGPREDGGFTPIISAPGASINTTQTWAPGGPVKEAGYDLPYYSMLQGTSMASPAGRGRRGAPALGGEAEGHRASPGRPPHGADQHRHIKDVPAHVQGSGLINIVKAWKQIAKQGKPAHEFSVKAPVDTAIDFALKDPGFGTGLYDREGGLKVGQSKVYDVVVTRTTGPDRDVQHKLTWKNNDGTFELSSPQYVSLPLDTPVKLKVRAKAKSAGVHSAILQLDDKKTSGVDHQIMTTVVIAQELQQPGYAYKASGSVQRNGTTSYFVNVPQGAKTLEVALSALRSGSQTRFIALHPYGTPVDPTATTNCYPNYENPANTCRPDARSYKDPQPGVWEIEVEARRTSPLLDNPYKLDVSLLGVEFDPAVRTIAEAKIGAPAPVSWKVTNKAAALQGKLQGGSLGSAKVDTPSISTGQTRQTTVTIGVGCREARRRHRRYVGRQRRPRPVRLPGRHAGRQRHHRLTRGVGQPGEARRGHVHRRRRGLLGSHRVDHVRLPGRVLLGVARHAQGRLHQGGEPG